MRVQANPNSHEFGYRRGLDAFPNRLLPPYPRLPSSAAAVRFADCLLAWFDVAKRDLPWRRSRDPYAIWVSEVMLQQTTVTTVAPRFSRFLDAFPTLAALAAAEEADVLRAWEGLGYYRRARDLHRAARVLVTNQHENLPDDPEAFAELPGVGKYTLGAVLSQAFGRRLPILEANSVRVLCRLFECRADPQSTTVQRWLWSAAEALLPQKRVGDFNQALMELGALICTPRQPACARCPVAKSCRARAKGRPEVLPLKSRTPAITPVIEVAVVLERAGRVLLVQRPATGRWAGLWEFPHLPRKRSEPARAAAQRAILDLTGYRAQLGNELITLKHGFTRFAITITCFRANGVRGRFRSAFYAAHKWLHPSQLTDYPMSTPQRRIANASLPMAK